MLNDCFRCLNQLYEHSTCTLRMNKCDVMACCSFSDPSCHLNSFLLREEVITSTQIINPEPDVV